MIRRGRVLEVLPSGWVWVTVPSLTGEVPVGPLPCAVLPRALKVGDEVLVAHLDGQRSELMVVGVTATWQASDVGPDMEGYYTAVQVDGLLAGYHTAAEVDALLGEVRTAAQDAQGKAGQASEQAGRAIAAATQAGAQAGTAAADAGAALEAVAALDARLDTLEAAPPGGGGGDVDGSAMLADYLAARG